MSKHTFQAYTSFCLSSWCENGSIGRLERDFVFQVGYHRKKLKIREKNYHMKTSLEVSQIALFIESLHKMVNGLGKKKIKEKKGKILVEKLLKNYIQKKVIFSITWKPCIHLKICFMGRLIWMMITCPSNSSRFKCTVSKKLTSITFIHF